MAKATPENTRRVCARCERTFYVNKPSRPGKYCSRTCSARLPVERFWDRVDMTDGPHGCWLWLGTCTAAGYGWMSVNGEQCYAHRLILELGGITIPAGAHVLHSCDNPPCTNPSHLTVANNAANRADSVRKGRHQHGEAHWRAALTTTDVIQIRDLCSHGMARRWVAEQYGVTHSAVTSILLGRTWKHV